MSAQTLLERALATPALAEDPTSERILDAALDLVGASGLRNLTMDDAAARAGVGRMTVYRRFGTKEGLVNALAAREARRCIAELDRAVDPSLPVSEGIAQGFVKSIELIRTHPVLARMARYEPEAALEAINADDSAILVLGREFVAARMRDAQERGDLQPSLDVTRAAELVVRLGFSFLLIPQSSLDLDDPESAAETARALIAPILG
jgi:AcrR family transcriptional regulator